MMWDRFKAGDLCKWRADVAEANDWGDVYVVVEARNLIDTDTDADQDPNYQELVVMGGDGQTHEIEDAYMVLV